MSHAAVLDRALAAGEAQWIELVPPRARERRPFELFQQRIELPEGEDAYPHVKTVPFRGGDVL